MLYVALSGLEPSGWKWNPWVDPGVSAKRIYEVESNQNFLKYISLYEYLNLLDIFTAKNSTLKTELPNKYIFTSKDAFYQKDVSIEEFQCFIENKIFKLDEINELAVNNEISATIFKEICIEIYRALELKLRQHYDSNDDVVIKKKNLIPLGLLFCNCNNIEKIKLLFDLFKNENEEFCKSDELDNFMLSDLLTASYCLISARNKIGKNFDTIEELKNDELIKLVNCAELKDNQHLVNVFNQTFFNKEKLHKAKITSFLVSASLFSNILLMPAFLILSSEKSTESARNLLHISAYFGSSCIRSLLFSVTTGLSPFNSPAFIVKSAGFAS